MGGGEGGKGGKKHCTCTMSELLLSHLMISERIRKCLQVPTDLTFVTACILQDAKANSWNTTALDPDTDSMVYILYA